MNILDLMIMVVVLYGLALIAGSIVDSLRDLRKAEVILRKRPDLVDAHGNKGVA